MAYLKNEYIDANNITHKVEHIIVSAYDKNNKEHIAEELSNALTRPDRHIPA